MKLDVFQSTFIDALLDQEKQSYISDYILPSAALSIPQRLAIYRNSITETKIKALSKTYPVCLSLLGEDCFRNVAKAYFKAHEWHGHNLLECGKNFPEFLITFEPLKGLAYLPDVAQLEWVYHIALNSPFVQLSDFSILAKLTGSDYERLHFHIAPTSKIIETMYPILHIWKHNQPGSTFETMVLSEERNWVLLYKRGWDIYLEQISEQDSLFMKAIQSAGTFSQVCEICLNKISQSKFENLLVKAISKQWLVGVSTSLKSKQ